MVANLLISRVIHRDRQNSILAVIRIKLNITDKSLICKYPELEYEEILFESDLKVV